MKTKSSVLLSTDQNLEETRNKSIQLGQNEQPMLKVALIVWVQEQKGDSLLKKSPDKDDECDHCFSNYYTAKSMKNDDWMCCQNRNVWYCTTKYAFVRKARANLLVVDATDWNYITKWWELYVRIYIFDQV
jgi:hypothetical protein